MTVKESVTDSTVVATVRDSSVMSRVHAARLYARTHVSGIVEIVFSLLELYAPSTIRDNRFQVFRSRKTLVSASFAQISQLKLLAFPVDILFFASCARIGIAKKEIINACYVVKTCDSS